MKALFALAMVALLTFAPIAATAQDTPALMTVELRVARTIRVPGDRVHILAGTLGTYAGKFGTSRFIVVWDMGVSMQSGEVVTGITDHIETLAFLRTVETRWQ